MLKCNIVLDSLRKCQEMAVHFSCFMTILSHFDFIIFNMTLIIKEIVSIEMFLTMEDIFVHRTKQNDLSSGPGGKFCFRDES